MSSANYVKFGPQEMVVQFATDRGEMKTNENGEYFFRAFADKRRFACINPDLERRLIELDYRAFDQVGIARQSRNRTVVWAVRLIEPANVPSEPEVRPAPRPVPMRTPPALPPAIPPSKYAPPPGAWPELEPPAKAAHPRPVAQERAPLIAPAAIPFDDGGLLGRCLCQALDGAKAAQAYAATIGLPTLFGPGEIERMAVSIFIERTRNGSVTDRKPAGNQGYVNGAAEAWNGRSQ